MSDAQRDLDGLLHQRDVAETKIEFAKRVERLLANPDFRAVILEEYCVQEAARFVQQSGDPGHSDRERADALASAQAPGYFKRWLQATQIQSAQLIERMPELNEEIELARAEVIAEEE